MLLNKEQDCLDSWLFLLYGVSLSFLWQQGLLYNVKANPNTTEHHVIENHTSSPVCINSSDRGEERQIPSMFQHLTWQIFVSFGTFCLYKLNVVIVFENLPLGGWKSVTHLRRQREREQQLEVSLKYLAFSFFFFPRSCSREHVLLVSILYSRACVHSFHIQSGNL